jgi:hypothetical protein
MFENKTINIEGIAFEDIPIFNSNQTESEAESVFPIGIDKRGRLVRKSLSGFSGDVPSWQSTVEVNDTISNLNSSLRVVFNGSDSQLGLLASFVSSTSNIQRSIIDFSGKRIQEIFIGITSINSATVLSNNSHKTYVSDNTAESGVSLIKNSVYAYSTDPLTNRGTLKLDPTFGAVLEGKNSLSDRSSVGCQPGGKLLLLSIEATKTTQVLLDKDGVSFSQGAVGSKATFNTESLTVNRLYTMSNAAGRIPVVNYTAPASAVASGVTGEFRVDAGFLYVCTSANTWRRVAIAAW